MNENGVSNLEVLAKRYGLKEITVKARTVLLREGQKAGNFYFVKQGCPRLWLTANGRQVTTQFFFEGSGVASLESILTNKPSELAIEALEKSTLLVMEKKQFQRLLKEDADFFFTEESKKKPPGNARGFIKPIYKC